ncbi:receptor-like protein kinase [Trifolium medium]|uniref:Receptor-like protein kinase n=1 Tax=Trifolium medium TaxID=97028 RepID=A0A392MFY0_9FABA|nr:receptor-like protein kinase [Trifolium medium]
MKNVTQVKEDGSLAYMKILLFYETGSNVYYYDSVTVTMKGTNMQMVKIPTIFVSIDLSRNKFEGEIPNVIGKLRALKGLNLSHNRLVGHIPQSMGNLTNLEWLDLSSNMLTSQIPAELTNLDFLAYLDLSNNHLVGEIPQVKRNLNLDGKRWQLDMDVDL